MKEVVRLLALVVLLSIAPIGCGTTPEPAQPAPTQAPGTTELAPTQPPRTLAPTEGEKTATPASLPPTPTRPFTATPAESVEATATSSMATAAPEATATAAPPGPTDTAQPDFKFPAPQLLAPTDGVSISWNYTVLLEWSAVAKLAPDQYYRLHLDAVREVNGEPWYGDYVFTKDTSYRVEGAFLAPFHPPEEQGRAVVSWWVEVVRKTGEDVNGKPVGVPISPASEKWTFITEPKPGD
jgi:hypothetical protein